MVETRNLKSPVPIDWKRLPTGSFTRPFQDAAVDYRPFGTPAPTTLEWPGARKVNTRWGELPVRMPADIVLKSGQAPGVTVGASQPARGDGAAARDPISTWLSCMGDNPICARKKRYQKAAEDPELNAVTTFPKAAATVLDYVDTPRVVTGFSKETADWYEGLSSRLEKANFDIFADLKARKAIPGITDAEDGIDRGMVRFEQAQVQKELDALKRSNPKLYMQVIRESDGTFERWKDANAAIGVSRRKLGHMPDFANEAERRRIGYETVRNEAAWSCARGGVCDARTLNGD